MKRVVYEIINSIQSKFYGPVLRNVGRKMYEVGTKIQGQYGSEDRLVPSLRNLEHEGFKPQLQRTDFVAPNATVIGNVKAGQKSSIWYGATIIGTEGVKIGDNTVIQDRTHISRKVQIGNNVFIGPNCILQGSIINNRAYVAMGATVRHAIIQEGGFVAAGAVIPDNTVVKQGQIWAGNPAKFLRLITPLQRQVVYEHLDEMKDLACIHSQQSEKSYRQLMNGQLHRQMGNFEMYMDNLSQNPVFSLSQNDEEFLEQRVLLKQKIEYPQITKDYQPYSHDMSEFSQKYRVGIHDEQIKRVATKIKHKEEFQTDRNPWTQPF